MCNFLFILRKLITNKNPYMRPLVSVTNNIINFSCFEDKGDKYQKLLRVA